MRNGHLNLLGERFGQLTVIKELPYRINKFGKKEYMWLCQCDCGETIEECTHNLRQGCAVRCRQCYLPDFRNANKTHGESHNPLYDVWTAIKQRCYNPNDNNYPNYGGRGIKMCDDWKNNYISFRDWALSNGYDENADHRTKCTIDRIDVNGDYCPDNCRWTDAKTQMRNRRCTIMCYFNGELIPLVEISERLNISANKAYSRWRKCGKPSRMNAEDFI